MKLISKNKQLTIRAINEEDLRELWEISFGPQADLKWMEFNGPYFNDPVQDWETFQQEHRQGALANPHRGLIVQDGRIRGEVFAYWEDGALKRWLEIGIILYDAQTWGQGSGTTALRLWLPYLFALYPDIQHIGYTTWSGNHGMMVLGEKVGMTLEGRIRKVRFHQGNFYDSVKYGILREELPALE